MSASLFLRLRGGYVLLGLWLAAVAGLASMWLDSNGQLRDIVWTPPVPRPVQLELPALPAGAAGGDADVGRLVATLDRPLFSPSRRPPPPPPPPAPPKPVDPLADVQLFGVFGGNGVGGVLARFNGQLKRVKVNENIGEWTVKGVRDREVTFARGDETRVLRLAHQIAPRAPTAQVAVNPGAQGIPLDRQAMQQQAMAEARERLRSRNEALRKAGLPTINE